MDNKVVRANTNDLAVYIANVFGAFPGLTYNDMVGFIQNGLNSYVATHTPNLDVPLSGVAVDFETNKAEMLTILAANPVWKDTVTGATGQIILEMMATALTYMQFNIIRSAQETLFDTIRIDSSALAATRHLGVRIARNIPAGFPVTLTRTGDLSQSYEIKPYQQFATNSNALNISLFNRDTLVFPANTSTLGTTLYEGVVGNVVQVTSNGQPYQRFVLGDNNFSISDIDILCQINGVTWNRTSFADYFNIGLWESSGTDLVFTDDTTADGNVEINFGNGRFGKIPDNNSSIVFTYVLTNGAGGNINLTASNITANFVNNITGTITGPGANGNNALSPMEYRSLGPGLFAAKYRASTRQDHAAIARRYPGVIDAIFEFQEELAPFDLRQMLVSRCTLLTNTIWSTIDFNNFNAWFKNLDMANMQVNYRTAQAVPLNIVANVYCFNSAALDSIQSKIIANLQTDFVLRSGILGYNRAVSDIGGIIESSDRQQIDYYDIVAPTLDTNIVNYQYVTLGTVIINMAYTNRVSR